MAQWDAFNTPKRNALEPRRPEAIGADAELGRQMTELMPNLRAFATSLSGDPERGRDLAQETFLKAWGHKESFTAGTNLRAWMFTILRNTFLTEKRRERREELRPSEWYDKAVGNLVSYTSNAEAYVDLSDVRRALATMNPDQRDALMLVAGSGFSYDEAAEVLGCAVGTIKSRVNRARRELFESADRVSIPRMAPERKEKLIAILSGRGAVEHRIPDAYIGELFERLDGRTRRTLELSRNGMSQIQIAEALGIPNRRASRRLAHAREALRRVAEEL